MRLVDADDVERLMRKVIYNDNSEAIEFFNYKKIAKQLVDGIPTAYDVDAVKNNINKMINNAYAEGDHDIASTLEMALGEVKKGGVE